MRRVLMIAPHFPPDTGAATHRVRLLAPHLPEFGWTPTVLTVDPSFNESRQDPDLAEMVPRDLAVVRAPAWSTTWTRKLGIGDLGLRAFTGLYRESAKLLESQKFDALFITIFPTYPALLGPLAQASLRHSVRSRLHRSLGQRWGKDVGGGKKRRGGHESRLTRAAALRLEPVAVRAADAITAVSAGTYEMIQDRIPSARQVPCAAIPYGGDVADFEYLRASPRRNTWFDRNDGHFHICYMGTLLPLGFDTLRAVFKGFATLREKSPEVFERIRFHFFGTSNQTAGSPDARVLPIARELGVEDHVKEHPLRVDYLDALTLQVEASAILLMGSTEPHYTASKLYPALLSGRPLLAVYHEESSVADIMKRVTSPPGAYVITYSASAPVGEQAAEVANALKALVENPPTERISWPPTELERFSARSLARELAAVFDQVAA
jgi:hypothetical protein